MVMAWAATFAAQQCPLASSAKTVPYPRPASGPLSCPLGELSPFFSFQTTALPAKPFQMPGEALQLSLRASLVSSPKVTQDLGC